MLLEKKKMNKVAWAQKGDLAAAQLKQKMLGINV